MLVPVLSALFFLIILDMIFVLGFDTLKVHSIPIVHFEYTRFPFPHVAAFHLLLCFTSPLLPSKVGWVLALRLMGVSAKIDRTRQDWNLQPLGQCVSLTDE
jgi:hypothetical protein